MHVQRPLIAICGTTGVGKSRLAVDLALSLQKYTTSIKPAARIINADSMQVYDGFDILTNKIPVQQQRGIDHLLMGFKKSGEQYEVGEWLKDAIYAIEETHREGQIPIVVGGTAYWIQHLLFTDSLPSSRSNVTDRHAVSYSETLLRSLQQLPDDLLYLFHNLPIDSPSANIDMEAAYKLFLLLSQLDSTMASRWHWRDTRKVLRNLQIIKEYGRTATEVVTTLWPSFPRARYRSLIFWLYADTKSLDPRLDQRVDDMMNQGLLDELRELNQTSLQILDMDDVESSELAGPTAGDFQTVCTKGIYQAIGFREFREYFISLTSSPSSLALAVVNMKQNTRRYARRQIKWIRNKLIPAIVASRNAGEEEKHKGISYYLLDATEVDERWNSEVYEKAVVITRSFMADEILPDPVSICPVASKMLAIVNKPDNAYDALVARRKKICPTCTTDQSRPVMLDVESEWEAHEKTKAHRYSARKCQESVNEVYEFR